MITSESWVVPLLSSVREISPNAHIAGGYLRDLDNGKPIKDVDVFVDSASDLNEISEIVRRTHPKDGTNFEDDPTYDAHTGNIASSYEFLDADEILPPVNVIKIDNLPGMLKNIQAFDFGICQIGFDGNGVIKTDEYLRDQDNEDFRLVQCLNGTQYVRSMNRWERLRKKYREWRLYVPKQFRQHTLLGFEEIF
jgi:hypothetical protein